MTQLSRFSVQRRMARKKRVPRVPRVPMLIPDNYEIDTSSLMNFGQPGSLTPVRRIKPSIGWGWGRK